VRAGVDLALQQFLGTGHRQRGHLLAQVFLGAVGGGLDLGLGQRLLAAALGDRIGLGRVDQLVGALVGLSMISLLAARGLEFFVDLVLRLREVLLRVVGGGQARRSSAGAPRSPTSAAAR
jgi:hypothetical protein